MTNTTVKMEINPDKFWSEMPLGAKLAGSIVAIVLIGASLVASVFLAGAALFGALVMMVYGALAGRGKGSMQTDVEQDVQGVVVKTEL